MARYSVGQQTGVDPATKCARCGHSRWQHQRLSNDRRVSGCAQVKPAKCLKVVIGYEVCSCIKFISGKGRK